MDKHHTLLNPGELVEIGDTVYRLRYITYHGVKNMYYFSPGNEQLSPFVQNDVLTLSVGKEESLRLKVLED